MAVSTTASAEDLDRTRGLTGSFADNARSLNRAAAKTAAQRKSALAPEDGVVADLRG